jgi:hypothetical protein
MGVAKSKPTCSSAISVERSRVLTRVPTSRLFGSSQTHVQACLRAQRAAHRISHIAYIQSGVSFSYNSSYPNSDPETYTAAQTHRQLAAAAAAAAQPRHSFSLRNVSPRVLALRPATFALRHSAHLISIQTPNPSPAHSLVMLHASTIADHPPSLALQTRPLSMRRRVEPHPDIPQPTPTPAPSL